MLGKREILTSIEASNSRAMRLHNESMESIHELNMQIEAVYSVLQRLETQSEAVLDELHKMKQAAAARAAIDEAKSKLKKNGEPKKPVGRPRKNKEIAR